jgi:hypothetical protein
MRSRKALSLSLGAALVLTLVLAAPVAATDPIPGDAEPIPGVGPTEDAMVTEDAYRGSPSAIHRHGEKCPPGQICTKHFSFQPHGHFVDAITSRYDGYYDYSTGYGCTGPCTLSATQSMSWSNKWGVSIGFDKGPINATVGYDVTYSTSWTFSFSFPVAAGQTKVVRYRDWYHVTRMNVHTTYYRSGCGAFICEGYTEWGTAWAGKWYQRIFYAQLV